MLVLTLNDREGQFILVIPGRVDGLAYSEWERSVFRDVGEHL